MDDLGQLADQEMSRRGLLGLALGSVVAGVASWLLPKSAEALDYKENVEKVPKDEYEVLETYRDRIVVQIPTHGDRDPIYLDVRNEEGNIKFDYLVRSDIMVKVDGEKPFYEGQGKIESSSKVRCERLTFSDNQINTLPIIDMMVGKYTKQIQEDLAASGWKREDNGNYIHEKAADDYAPLQIIKAGLMAKDAFKDPANIPKK